LLLTGDIFSFPSQAAVEWAFQALDSTGIPWAYVAGNHDWHYEGMERSSYQLRNTWTTKHLYPMYQGNHPLMLKMAYHKLSQGIMQQAILPRSILIHFKF
jgi:hypothetical protein